MVARIVQANNREELSRGAKIRVRSRRKKIVMNSREKHETSCITERREMSRRALLPCAKPHHVTTSPSSHTAFQASIQQDKFVHSSVGFSAIFFVYV